MRLITLTTAAFVSISAAAPTPQFDLGALLGGGGAGGINLGGLLGGLGGGSGAPSVDSAPILKSYDTIKTEVDKLNSVILKFSNATSPTAVLNEYLAAGVDTIKAYNASIATISALNGTVSIVSALGFLTPRSSLTTSIETALSNLIAKKDSIAKAQGTAQVLLNLKDQKTAAQAYSAAALSKLPDLAQGIAASSASKPLDAIDKAITAFT